MRVLYQFPLSHFCEKVRWMLDHKELEYVAHNLAPGVHRAFAKLKTGQYKLPILHDQQAWIADSTEIALYLDRKYPEHVLLSSKLALREQALALNHLSNDLGRHVRRWVLSHTLDTSEQSIDLLIGERGYLRQFEKYSKPLIKTLVVKGYRLDPDTVAASKQQLDLFIQQLNQRLIDHQGQYLVGNCLGLADIAICSMLAPLLAINGTPWEKEQDTHRSILLQDYKAFLEDLPLGQYVQRIYRDERNARVDWRGV
ncbi:MULTISPECIES: glutathione S-transferase family protein [unclassified Acinetobacter]|uniref:glutathione S-transferase family protein n=1 Tax=unclassified Acinetobacter TaxID=196816 RepID=UPI002934B77C|nr:MULTISPECIES: glutathione S-transferase family protein [unclassified Acinetobacter]WOE32527.1 glutathione S-transferase family protein [Acinetobacter sp. SAAs470]WOE38003.1 glutathione S-transferase family protein [Acinetobacter sp. SAAs474]